MAKERVLNIDFATAASPDWLTKHLPQHIWRDDEQPGSVQNVQIKKIWESSKRVTVLYDIAYNGSVQGGCTQQYVGYIVPDDNLEKEFSRTAKKAKTIPPVGKPVALLKEANLVLAAFPNERRMPLIQVDDFAQWLPKNLQNISFGEFRGQTWDLLEGEIETLKYVPDKRYTTMCNFRLRGKKEGGFANISFVAKQLADDKKARFLLNSLRKLARAWDGAAEASDPKYRLTGPVRIPRPLGKLPHKPVVFIETIIGQNLKHVLDEINQERVLPKTGALLANFHKADRRVRTKITCRNEIEEVRETGGVVSKTLPMLENRIKAFFKAWRSVTWQDDAPEVILHGSYRLNHIFINADEELALLDLDSVRMGRPAYDIANFIASNYYLEAQGRFSAEERRRIHELFLQGYCEHTGFSISQKSVLWFLASLLINKQAFKYVNHSHGDAAEKVELMLSWAEKCLANCLRCDETALLDELSDLLP